MSSPVVIIGRDTVTVVDVAQQGPQGPQGPAGAGGGSSSFTAVNKDAVTLAAGSPVAAHPSGTGLLQAVATGVARSAVGLMITAVAPTFSAAVQTAGLFALADWTAVTGTVTLAPLSPYYLDVTAGKLTTVAPTTPGQIVQPVGRAVAPDTLDLGIEETILL